MKKSNAKPAVSPAFGWGVAAILILIAAAGVYYYVPPSLHPLSPAPIEESIPIGTPLKAIPHFSSEADILAKFSEAQQNGNTSLGGGMMRENMVAPSAAPASADAGKSASGPSYSTTNVQVQGVDEADLVKTDGQYIYSFYKNKLIISKAYPATEMEVVSTLNLDTIYPEQMYVNGNKLVLFGSKYESYSGPNVYGEKMMSYPIRGYWNQSRAILYVYDISDKSKPTIEKSLEFPGSNLSSRMIENNVYFVVNTYPYYPILYAATGYPGTGVEGDSASSSDNESIIPPYKEDGIEKPLARPTDIGYLPPINAQSFLTIGALNLDTKQLNKETIVGNAEQVYASPDNLYLTSTNWNYAQPIPLGAQIKIGMPIYRAPNPTTEIFKFHLTNGSVSFAGRGEVQGHILNQFSMDEFKGNFRIATTRDAQYDEKGQISDPQSNAVYVLNEDMSTAGKIEDIAPGEQIYSVRFMGERAYMVTFKQIDPLFVLDLSNPSNPSILGKLKIPGYSNYLHPLDETHILGIGKDTEDSKQGDFAYYLGMKMAIFDVSDVEHPVQQYSLVVGDRGTDSPALYDHKAFLYDAEKQLLVIPVDYHEILEKKDSSKQPFEWPAYGVTTFQGAMVFHVSVQDGISEKGRITHISPEADLKSGYYYDYRYQVQRALFIGDVLYTISSKTIKANAASDLSEINHLDLVNTPKDFTITARTESGGLCAGPCGYQQVILNSDTIIQDSSSGGTKPTINHSERPVSSEYDDIVELLDWKAFQSLDAQIGCPGCADGPIETITIKEGSLTKTVKFDPTQGIESIQSFLNAINAYVGYYGYPIAVDTMGVGVSGSSGTSAGGAATPPSN